MQPFGILDVLCPWPWRGRLMALKRDNERLLFQLGLANKHLEEANGVMRAVSATLAKAADKKVAA